MWNKVIKFLSSFIVGSSNRKLFRSSLKKFNLFTYFEDKNYYSNLNYKIIPIGQNCLPRILASRAKLKPYKIYGELTCPFDLNYHQSLDQIISILDSKFENYFDGLGYDESEKTYINYKTLVVYFHDAHLTIEKFKKLYIRRINNFFHYMSLEKHLFFVLATSEIVSNEQMLHLKNSIYKLREGRPFSLIVINHNLKNNLIFEDKSIFVINQEALPTKAWVEELETEKGIIFYNNIVEPMKDFIQKTINEVHETCIS